MTTTDTPRTDAVMASSNWPCHITSEMQKLERELNEVNKLNHQLLKTENDLLQSQDINSFLDTEFRIACKRAEKAEAEVERLAKEGELYRAANADVKRIAEERNKAEAEVKRLTDAIKSCWHAANTYDGKYARACDNVMTISSEALDPTNK